MLHFCRMADLQEAWSSRNDRVPLFPPPGVERKRIKTTSLSLFHRDLLKHPKWLNIIIDEYDTQQ